MALLILAENRAQTEKYGTGKFGFFVQILRNRKQRIKKMKYALDNLQTLDI